LILTFEDLYCYFFNFCKFRCSHGFCHACLEMYIHNENDRIARDSSKYSIHKTIATIKAGNVSGNKVDPMNEKNIVKDPYENFACPVCQHDEEERGHSCGAAQIKNRKSTIPFHRSENLDSIIYLCQQASSLADREVMFWSSIYVNIRTCS
jgi:hypothetical protein